MTTVDQALARTEQAQRDASDPAASVWVAANAGAGKTHVLKMRVLRLLLAGTAPERILCLTYTKAAAAEMSERVFGELATWATTDDQRLKALLDALTGADAGPEQMTAARKLFARAIETPGGLKVQTIHAFCERLLQRFPLEAGVPPGFSILDDAAGKELFDASLTAVLDTAVRTPESPLGRALGTIVVHVQGDAFDGLIREALGNRQWLRSIADLSVAGDDPTSQLRELYAQSLDLEPAATVSSLEAKAAALLDDATLQRAIEVLSASTGKLDNADARLFAIVRAARTSADRTAALAKACLTAVRQPRSDSRFMSKKIRAAEPALVDRITRARDRLADITVEIDAIRMVDATVALATIADAVMQGYADAKTRRAALDFEDLIERTAALLSISAAADWVLYKLDGGLDHLLVDEAQDTSPQQWSVVEALVREFYAGAGAREARTVSRESTRTTSESDRTLSSPFPRVVAEPRLRREGGGKELVATASSQSRAVSIAAPPSDGPRTVFAVGDEKQSIYSFQGAAPEKFAAVGADLAALAKASGLAWREVPLTLSFRTVPPILEAVDLVFADPERTPGLEGKGGTMTHQAKRAGAAGLVEIWPTEVPDDATITDGFDAGTERRTASPAQRLAARIAGLIDQWLTTDERLPSQNRRIEAGDIMILVSRRRPFADVMVAALKARGIAVAGADRMRLDDQLAVKDLLALGQVLVLPEDDLSLAAVLKSPLFDLTDDDLIRIAPKRAGSLYSAVMRHAVTDPRIAAVAEALKRWRAIADRRPPFEFYARLLDEDGMRQRLIRRLGPEAIDAIDELLAQALAFDDGEPASLQGFLTQMQNRSHEVRRDMEPGRNQVRVLTVHGSKGLEAPIVFLPDTCGKTAGADKARLVPLTEDWTRDIWPISDTARVPPRLVWQVKGANRIPAIGEAKAELAAKADAERNRLLYVALTRARDRLYVAGFEGLRPRDPRGWYDSVVTGLSDRLETVVGDDGREVGRLARVQTGPVEPPKAEGARAEAAIALPAWAVTRAAREVQLTIPLAPSRIMPLDVDDEGEPVVAASIRAAAIAANRDGTAASGRPAATSAQTRASSGKRGDKIGDMAEDVQPRREPSSPSPRVLATDQRFLRGRLTHAMLEYLPDLPPGDRAGAADRFLAVRGRDLSAKVRNSICSEALALLEHAEFAAVFGPGSRAEVPIVAEVPQPTGDGPALRIVGQIDRLVKTDHGVMIIDFKTNRPPPLNVADVPPAYVLQLAAYRLALQQIFGVSEVRAALLWTDGARLMPLPTELLDAYLPLLWATPDKRPD